VRSIHKLISLAVVAVFLCLAVSSSPAQPPKGKKGDGDKGGGKARLTETEMIDDIVTRMMAFDKNMDGKLTKEEVTDTRLHRLFDRADANKDGFVTRDELVAVAKAMVAEMASEGGGKGGKGGEKGPKGDKGGKGGKGGFDKGGFDKGGKGGFDKGGFDKGGKGGFGGPPQAGVILSPITQEMLNLTADQKKLLGELQSDVDSKLDKILTDEQKQQLKQMRDMPPGFGKGKK